MSNRVFYASQGVKVGSSVVQGAQSVGIQSNFTLEQAFQLGQLSIYNNAVTNPEVTVTISKILDGQDTIYKLATQGGSLVSNEADRVDIIVAVGADTGNSLVGTQAVKMTGMYLSSVSYTMPVDGFMTEEVTFLGDNKKYTTTAGDLFNGPTTVTGEALRRQNFASSTVPSEVSGQNITNITINADLGREAMFKLGQFGPFHRFTNFPLEVTCEFEVSATGLDTVEVSQNVTCTGGDVPGPQSIVINLCDPADGTTAYIFNLGNQNVLSSVNYQGGDTGGGNATITYSYTTYNDLDISG
jgi:hypothetical protein